ncbi:MAG: hypothetical protein JSV97_00365 [candidate division WOR-3 bacterium]|nr:MAG: hypothetical protein JSV97_00365 [candidate division WOR-3 bacterium]
MKEIMSIFFLFVIVFTVECGQKKEEARVPENTPPYITSAFIIPNNPQVGSRLNLRIDAGDKEGDKISYTVKWFLNNEEIGEGVEFYVSEVKRGDMLYAEITPSDGKTLGEPVNTAVIKVGNSPPEITRVTISPDAVFTSSDELTITGEGFDVDNDSLTYFCYWALNRTELLLDTSTTIPLKNLNLKKGSVLRAELYAFDGSAVSAPYTVDITIGNSPPILIQDIDSIFYNYQNITYQLPIVDPDNDPMTFELLESPPGITIDQAEGRVYGSVEKAGEFEIVVRATDVDGAYLDARFTLTVPE